MLSFIKLKITVELGMVTHAYNTSTWEIEARRLGLRSVCTIIRLWLKEKKKERKERNGRKEGRKERREGEREKDRLRERKEGREGGREKRGRMDQDQR
jgi:hypothetical protein